MTTGMAQPNNPPNVQALADLRPGMPVSRVKDAIGDKWRELAPHKGGKIDILENSHGIVIRIDKDGLIGWVTYDHRFKYAVDGLRMQMPLKEAEAAMPDLAIGPDLTMMRGVRVGGKTLPAGTVLRVKFTLESINGIELVNQAASYPEPTAPPYPAANGAPGAPFADANFKLVVLSSLLDAKVIDLGTPRQLASHVLGRPVDLEDEGYDLIPAAQDYLARYPLTEDLLAQVESLVFDGGSSIYRYIQYFWDGEDGAFDVHDLSGIEACPNVASQHFISMMDRPPDIRRLVPLRKLEQLSVDGDIEHPEALLDLPALKSVKLMSDRFYGDVMKTGHPTQQLFETLKSKGVGVRIHWMTYSGNDRPPPFE
jgi:hypothetical protein